MGEKEALARVAPAKDSSVASCGQKIDSVWLIRLRKNGASGRVQHMLDGIDPYINCIKRSITTMPTIFRREVIDGVWVMGIIEDRGA